MILHTNGERSDDRILDLLARRGPLSTNQIALRLNLGQANVQIVTRKLCLAGKLDKQRDAEFGRTWVYRVKS